MRKQLNTSRLQAHLVCAALLAPLVLSSHASAVPAGPAMAPIQRGIDMLIVDGDAAPPEPELKSEADAGANGAVSAARAPAIAHPTFAALTRQLTTYQTRWSVLPQHAIPDAQQELRAGDRRVRLLRTRLGLSAGAAWDSKVRTRLTDYQRVHGLPANGRATPRTLESLNRGAAHYEALLRLNMARARRLPPATATGRYIVVDAGAARLFMYDNGRAIDSMRVIVGKQESQTPMMAAMVRHVTLNPYWNVPSDLVANVAKQVVREGLTYLNERDYDVLSDWTDAAARLEPSKVDWAAVAAGNGDLRLRRGPGPWNAMGQVKFMLPNVFGIYLHDVPASGRAAFTAEDRWVSNGCVRVEDARRLLRWLFGEAPRASGTPDQRVDLPEPLPIYFTYLTADPESKTRLFRPDRYQRDGGLVERFLANPGLAERDVPIRGATPTRAISKPAAPSR